MREFDIFSKVDPTAPRVKTVSSGAGKLPQALSARPLHLPLVDLEWDLLGSPVWARTVSILCFFLLGYLFLQEVAEYQKVEVTSQVSVDTTIRNEFDSLLVSLTVEFPSTPLLCAHAGGPPKLSQSLRRPGL